MRSSSAPKVLECHAFVCHTPEDAIVIAATLYQSLMTHMGSNEVNSLVILNLQSIPIEIFPQSKSRKPKTRNGISCISIASSTATTNVLQSSVRLSTRRTNSQRSSMRNNQRSMLPAPPRPPRIKRPATSSISNDSDAVQGIVEESSTEERQKKNNRSKRPPPLPANPPRKRKYSP
jgi:hypothetical protein